MSDDLSKDPVLTWEEKLQYLEDVSSDEAGLTEWESDRISEWGKTFRKGWNLTPKQIAIVERVYKQRVIDQEWG